MLRRSIRSCVKPLAVTAIVLGGSAFLPEARKSVSANEAAAIAILRSISEAQVEVQRAVDIDTDCDRVGEYAYLAELAGRQPVRVCIAGYPAAGVHGVDEIDPPLLPPSLGRLEWSAVKCTGYVFQLWLPSHPYGPGGVYGVAEDHNGGKLAAPFPDPSTGERYWCCYAWPIDAGATGNRAFFINQVGVVLQCSNHGSTPYSGFHKKPGFGEAYQVLTDMASGLRLGPPAAGADDTIWTKL